MAMLLFAFFIRGGNFGIVTTPQLGLTVVGPVTVFVAGCAASNVRPGELLVTAFALTAALLLVFADLLGLGIPIFPRFLEDAIPRSIGSIGATRVVYIAYGASAAALYVLIFGRGGKGRG